MDVSTLGHDPCLGKSAWLGVQGFRQKVIREPGGVRGDLSSLDRESAGVQRRGGEAGRRGGLRWRTRERGRQGAQVSAW